MTAMLLPELDVALDPEIHARLLKDLAVALGDSEAEGPCRSAIQGPQAEASNSIMSQLARAVVVPPARPGPTEMQRHDRVLRSSKKRDVSRTAAGWLIRCRGL